MKSHKFLESPCWLPDGYELFMHVYDGMKRYHKYCASPVRGGVINYFESLRELRSWCAKVEDIRLIQKGELTAVERIMDHCNAGELHLGIALGMLSSRYGTTY